MMIKVFVVTKKYSSSHCFGFWILQLRKVLENSETVESLLNLLITKLMIDLIHSGASPVERAGERSFIPIETGETDKNHASKLWNPSVSFFMVNMASGIARGRVLSPKKTTTTTAVEVSHQYGDLSHARLLNIRSSKGSNQLNGIEYPCQLTAVKIRNSLTSITWPHRRLRCSL